jgi:hypothetical protein
MRRLDTPCRAPSGACLSKNGVLFPAGQVVMRHSSLDPTIGPYATKCLISVCPSVTFAC